MQVAICVVSLLCWPAISVSATLLIDSNLLSAKDGRSNGGRLVILFLPLNHREECEEGVVNQGTP